MQSLKRSLIERILQCQDERLLRMVAQLLELEGNDPSLTPPPYSTLPDLLNARSGPTAQSDQDLKDIQDDIDEVFG